MIIEKKLLSDLIPASYNPRQSNQKQEEDLKASLKKLEVDCVIVDLSESDEKELNIRLNENTGSWDFDVLANPFSKEELQDFGSNDQDYSDANTDTWDFYQLANPFSKEELQD